MASSCAASWRCAAGAAPLPGWRCAAARRSAHLAHGQQPTPQPLTVGPRAAPQEERVTTIERIATGNLTAPLDQTLLCFVLVDPNSQHAFCSRYDFGPWPLLGGINSLPPAALEVRLSAAALGTAPSTPPPAPSLHRPPPHTPPRALPGRGGPARAAAAQHRPPPPSLPPPPRLQVLARSRALFTNGFLFDELPLHVVVDAIEHAAASGTSVFFDPGGRPLGPCGGWGAGGCGAGALVRRCGLGAGQGGAGR
jgi:hypothetical protein